VLAEPSSRTAKQGGVNGMEGHRGMEIDNVFLLYKMFGEFMKL
jgi:hypothetical protein